MKQERAHTTTSITWDKKISLRCTNRNSYRKRTDQGERSLEALMDRATDTFGFWINEMVQTHTQGDQRKSCYEINCERYYYRWFQQFQHLMSDLQYTLLSIYIELSVFARGTRKLSQKIISTHFIALNNSKITEIKTKYLRTPIPSILHQVHFCPSRMSWLHAIASFSDFLRVIIALFPSLSFGL